MPNLVYLDSCVFLALLKAEAGRSQSVMSLFMRASEGQVKIAASALVITEVLNIGGANSPIPREKREAVRKLFRKDWIVIHDVTRRVAEMSQDLVWDYSVKPKDAIHLATALLTKIPTFYTFDKELLKLQSMSTFFGSVNISEPPQPV